MMKIPHIIERWLARYSDGEAEGAHKKLMDDWVQNSPELQKEVDDQQAVSSRLTQTFSNPAIRAHMEAKLNQALSTLPKQAKSKPNAWSMADLLAKLPPIGLSNIRLMKLPHVSSRTLGAVTVVLFLGIIAVFNGPVVPPNRVMEDYRSQSDIAREGLSIGDANHDALVLGDASVLGRASSKQFSESTQSRGIAGPPGVVSNRQDDGISSDYGYQSNRRFSQNRPTNDYSSLGISGNGEIAQAYDFYMRVYGDKFKDASRGYKGSSISPEAQRKALGSYWKQYGTGMNSQNTKRLQSLGYMGGRSNQNNQYGLSGGMGMMGGMGMGAMGGISLDDDGDSVLDDFGAVHNNRFSNGTTFEVNQPVQQDFIDEQIVSDVFETKKIAQGVTSNSNILDPDTSSQRVEPEESKAEEGRKIIRNARMALQVQDVLATKDSIEAMVKTAKGLISNANINQDSSVPSAHLTLWIPADSLEEMIEGLNELGKALNLEVFTNDITEQYFDMETRVRNLKIQEERLLQLYEREVKKLDEILQVEKEVQRVRTEIEQLEGRKRLYDRQVALSTIEVAIIQEPEKKPIVKSEPDSVFSPIRRVWRDAGAVFLYSCSIMTGMVASVVSTVIFFLPWLVVLALFGFVGRVVWKRYNR